MDARKIRRYEAQTQVEREAIRKLASYVLRPMLGDVQAATLTLTTAEARGLWDFLVGCNTELSDWRMAAMEDENGSIDLDAALAAMTDEPYPDGFDTNPTSPGYTGEEV